MYSPRLQSYECNFYFHLLIIESTFDSIDERVNLGQQNSVLIFPPLITN